MLVGLATGSYRIDIVAAGYATRSETLTVLIGQTVDLDLALAKAGDIQLQTVTITGVSGLDRKTSEVGTNVTQKQIDSLPQITRNFLAFADLAPGVRFDVDATGIVKVQSGAQNQDNINVFIDGVSQKSNILRGRASGMDSSRGNPFPQSAIAEYKVISQNYKAEFDQVSSAAITAVTKSGSNELHGDVFWDHTGQNLIAYSPFEKKNKDNGFDRAKFSQDQYGFTLGGPRSATTPGTPPMPTRHSTNGCWRSDAGRFAVESVARLKLSAVRPIYRETATRTRTVMPRHALIAIVFVSTLLAGCDMVTGAMGIELPERVAAAREAEGKAVGGACRQAGRAIEDCYAMNKKAEKAAVFAGWRDMNDYMRENKIEPVAPQMGTKTATAEAGAAAAADGADEAPAEGASAKAKPGTKPASRKAKAHDS